MWQHWNIVNIHDVANASVASITFCSAKDWNRLAVTWCSLDGGDTCFGLKLFLGDSREYTLTRLTFFEW